MDSCRPAEGGRGDPQGPGEVRRLRPAVLASPAAADLLREADRSRWHHRGRAQPDLRIPRHCPASDDVAAGEAEPGFAPRHGHEL